MSKRKSKQDLDLERELKAAGVISLEVMNLDSIGEIAIRQDSALCSTRVLETKVGITCFVLDVTITSSLSTAFPLRDYSLEVPWENPNFYWVPDPRERDPRIRSYQLPDCDLAFARKQVLNHRLPTIMPYQRLRGVLLGMSLDPIPSCYASGAVLLAKLLVTDEVNRSFSGELLLQVDRTARLTSKRVMKRQRLFDQPDKPESDKFPGQADKRNLPLTLHTTEVKTENVAHDRSPQKWQ
jgi:hypothetical protein